MTNTNPIMPNTIPIITYFLNQFLEKRKIRWYRGKYKVKVLNLEDNPRRVRIKLLEDVPFLGKEGETVIANVIDLWRHPRK